MIKKIQKEELTDRQDRMVRDIVNDITEIIKQQDSEEMSTQVLAHIISRILKNGSRYVHTKNVLAIVKRSYS